MNVGFPYSASDDPPCPVLTFRLSAPSSPIGIGLVGIIDTGADLTLVPEQTARVLALPTTSVVRLAGVTGSEVSAPVCAAEVELAGWRFLTEVIVFGDEPILGRDLLHRFVLLLNGPRRHLELRMSPRRRLRHPPRSR